MEGSAIKRVILAVILGIAMSMFFVSQPYAMGGRPAASKKAAPTILKTGGRVTSYSLSNSTVTISTSSGSAVTVSADKDTSIKTRL